MFIFDLLCGAVDVIEGTIDAVDNFVYENVTRPIDSVVQDTIGYTNTELVHGKVKVENFMEDVFPSYNGPISRQMKTDSKKKYTEETKKEESNKQEEKENKEDDDNYVIW